MIKPLPGYVLIEPMDDEEVTAGGLALPEKAKEKPAKGIVIAVGDSITHYESYVGKNDMSPPYSTTSVYNLEFAEEQSPVEEKDIAIFHRWAGQDVKDGQKEYKLVKFSDLMGVYEKE